MKMSRNIYRTVESLDDIINVVSEISVIGSKPGKRFHLWFRGHANIDWPLVPSIQRTGLNEEGERCMANDFRIRACQMMIDAPPKDNYASWVSVMQHYGIPTRLLDWSRSLLIALYFAVHKSDEQRDGCIWVLCPGGLNQLSGENTIHPLDSNTAQAMLQTVFKGHEICGRETLHSILACYSVSNDRRMYAQQSCFTLHNNRELFLESPKYSEVIHKLRIPGNRKEYFCEALRQFGISKSYIFPDLDTIADVTKGLYGLR